MATTSKIFIQIDDEKIELKGEEKEAFLKDQTATAEANAALQLEFKKLQELKISAYKKLGLTDEEIAAII